VRLREGKGERAEGRGGMSSSMPGDLGGSVEWGLCGDLLLGLAEWIAWADDGLEEYCGTSSCLNSARAGF